MEQKLSATPAPGSLASTPEASAKIAGEAPALTEPHKLPSLRALTARCREAAANKACDIGMAWNLIEEAADAFDEVTRVLDNASRIFEVTGMVSDAERMIAWREARATTGAEIDALTEFPS